MSWSFSHTGTPTQVHAAFEDYIDNNPLQGHEKTIRAKLVDTVREAGKGYSANFHMNFVASGSADRVDGVEVSETISISITPVAA